MSAEATALPVPTEASPAAPAAGTSPLRAWCYLVWLSCQRQARARQMVWIALALLGATAALTAVTSAAGQWTMASWRWRVPERLLRSDDRSAFVGTNSATFVGPKKPDAEKREPSPNTPAWRVRRPTFQETASNLEALAGTLPAGGSAMPLAVTGTFDAVLQNSGFYVFSRWMVFSLLLGFLLPIWSLSFATEAIGGEREARTLTWLLTRPLPRPAIYLAKFLGVLPWSLGLNLGGFALLCVLAGEPGLAALRLYWPAVLLGTLAFCALFHLMGALFRRAAIIALVYSFFLETILGNMPGMMKRISISFYTRCLMFDVGGGYGVKPDNPEIYLPVSGATAVAVLLGLTALFLAAGMYLFARTEYQDLN